MKYLISLMVAVFLVGCAVNDPVKTQSTVDDRPRITLDVTGVDAEDLELIIDGISYGNVSKYLSTSSALRILPGNHIIETYYNGRLVTEKTDYFGESTLTVIKVVVQ